MATITPEQINILKEIIQTSELLKKHYENFWNNMYNNDAYIYHKISMEYYKNIFNQKPHNWYSKIINEKLYNGSCTYVNIEKRKDFDGYNKDDKNINSNKANLNIDLDDLCRLSVSVINNLDNVFYVAPKLPTDIICYRTEFKKLNDELLNLNVGDYYSNNGYMSTTINPYYICSDRFDDVEGLYVQFIIILPKGSNCYYMNIPFGIVKNISTNLYVGYQEHEILLPRNNLFKVIDKKEIKNRLFILLQLIHQNKKQKPVIENTEKVLSQIIKKNDYVKFDKDNLINFEIAKETIDLAKHKYKNRIMFFKSLKLIRNLKSKIISKYHFYLLNIKTKYLKEWLNNKIGKVPQFDPIKYKDSRIYDQTELNEAYNEFINLQKFYSQTKNFFIVCYPTEQNDNQLYSKLSDAKINNVYKFDYPQIIHKILTNEMISQWICVCVEESDLKNVFVEDKNFPISIVLQIKSKIPIGYLKQEGDINFTHDIKSIKITQINKIYLANDFFITYITAKNTHNKKS